MAELILTAASKDNWLQSSAAGTNHGNDTENKLQDWTLYINRIITEFDISGLPAGSTVTDAKLELYYLSYVSGGSYVDPVGKTVWSYKLSRTDWVELQSSWNNYKTGSVWSTAGGDYVIISPVGGSATFPASAGWLEFDVTAIVNDAFGASVAAEFLTKLESETFVYPASGGSQINIASSEYTTDTAKRPKLTITYTPPDSPLVTTQSVTNISGTTATGNGNITSIGGASVTQHGHCWSTSHNPTTSDSKTTLGAGSVGVFTSSITGLTAGTKYYVKAYATNGGGTSYGAEVYFTADSGTVSPYDPLTRVSGITRIFYSGFGGSPVYQTILALGGMSNTYVSPMSDRETQSALGTREDINGQGYTQLDFASWMQRNNFAAIMKLFGHFPTYKEWVEWRKKGGADILGLMK
jgi:hypothetical protein